MRYKITGTNIIFTAVILMMVYYSYNALMPPSIWGDDNDEPYITITGKKPVDAEVKSLLRWGIRGEKCTINNFKTGDGWAKGKSGYMRITHDFSDTADRYELRVPYRAYQSEYCKVILLQVRVEAYNAFDGNFAQLRINHAGTDYYNKPRPLDSLIEARNCRHLYLERSNDWSTGLACSLYTNGKMLNRRTDAVNTSYTTHFNFAEFTDNTVLHYDILAGKEYRISAR